MARNCPNKQKRPQGQYNRQQQPFNKRQQQRSPNKPNFCNTFARVAEMLDSDDEEEFENLLAEDSISEHNELNISDLAARTARFDDTEREQWVSEMKKLGVDF